MPRYLVKRNFGHIDDEQMEMRGRKSKALLRDEFTQLTWEHSHVVASPEGEVFLFCVYGAPDEESVRAHADALGGHTVEAVYEIGGDVSPADFTI